MDQLTSALEDKSNLSILKWCDNGTGFIVLNWDDLCLSLIPKLFVKESQAHQSLETEKTMSSVDLVLKRRSTFLKQLNNYRKFILKYLFSILCPISKSQPSKMVYRILKVAL